jgi:hypothetical protein
MALSRTLVSRGPCLTNGNEHPLPGGTANRGLVVRVADTVVRPIAPCWPATHALLAHLRAVGFDGAPRLLSTSPSTETLSYMEGQAAVPPLPAGTLTDTAICCAGITSRSRPSTQPDTGGHDRYRQRSVPA